MLPVSEYKHAAAKGLKRPLDSHALIYELPPTTKIKISNSSSESFSSAELENGSLEALESPTIKVSNTENTPHQNDYGRRLIPRLIDERAISNPQGPVWSVPHSLNLADGFREIGYDQVARAINAAAWWIDEKVGKSTTFETLAYLGPPDLRYAILTIAAHKTGHTVSRKPSECMCAFCSYVVGVLLLIMEQYRSASASS